MTNNGTASNAALGAWKFYDFQMRAVGSSPTQPFLDRVDGQAYQFGRYQQDLSTGWVNGQIQAQFLGTSTVGAGDNYIFRLPRTARRLTPGSNDSHPIGVAMCYWSFTPAPNQNMPCTVTLANVAAIDSPDDWCQIYVPEILDQGSDVVPTSATSVTVTHRAGVAFSAADIFFMPTDNDIASTSGFVWVSSISSTQFTANVRGSTNPSGDGLGFAWTIRATPNTGSSGALVGPYVPWDWSKFTSLGPFGNIFIQLGYEASL